jgi:hypothetical protein
MKTYAALTAAFALSLSASYSCFAQSVNTTVLTMHPDGSWGVATESSTNLAIGNAIANCKKMSRTEIGCGAYSSSMRGGWLLGIRCGEQNIIVTATTRPEADLSALRQENELLRNYAGDMPPCRLLVSVDPNGLVSVGS